MAIEERDSSGEGKNEEYESGEDADSLDTDADTILREAIGVWFDQEKEKNPELFSFMEDDKDEIAKSLRDSARRKRQEEAGSSSTSGVDVDVELPMPFKEKIQEKKGYEVKFVMQKKLSETDLNPNLNNACFSIPYTLNNFLTENEELYLEENKVGGMHVTVLDPYLRECSMCFKLCSRTGLFYNFTNGWNHIVLRNDLKLHDTLQLWSFRDEFLLCFAFVKLSI